MDQRLNQEPLRPTPLSMPATLEAWLQTHIGHHVTTNNQNRIHAVLKEIASKTAMEPQHYLKLLTAGLIDPQPFIDTITTHESFFLRHRESMEAAIQILIPDWLRQGVRPQILSVGCAQGEEPYSMAMLLSDSGINPYRVTINGIDIAQCSIDAARQGQFSHYALRRTPTNFRNRHFFYIRSDELRIHPFIQQAVHFTRMNLLSEAHLLPQPVHLIYCHNLLIYCNRPTIQRALTILEDILHPDGWLFVDPVETATVAEMLPSQQLNRVVGFRKKALHTAAEPAPRTKAPAYAQKTITPPSSLLHEAHTAYRHKVFDQALALYEKVQTEQPAHKAQALLGEARIHADSGNDLLAMKAAETALAERQDTPMSTREKAQAHAIITLIMRNKGLQASMQHHFTQVKQLDPHHPVLRLSDHQLQRSIP